MVLVYKEGTSDYCSDSEVKFL